MIYGFCLIALAYVLHMILNGRPRGRRVSHRETVPPPAEKLDVYGVNEAKLSPYQLEFLHRLERQGALMRAQVEADKMVGGNVSSFKIRTHPCETIPGKNPDRTEDYN